MAENSFCKHSDYVVSLLCAAKEYFIKHGMQPEKFKVDMNGIVEEEWESPEELPCEHKSLLESLRREGKFIICFFGSITESYSIDYLIKAKKIINNDGVAVVIVGNGNQKEALQKMNVKDVYFLPSISKKAIPSLVNSVDCCYVGALRNDMFRFGICMNKLFDDMMSWKPILYAVEAPNNFISDYHCGISVKAENAEALADGIKVLLEMSQKERERMGQNGREAVKSHFTYHQLASEFAKLFQGTADS